MLQPQLLQTFVRLVFSFPESINDVVTKSQVSIHCGGGGILSLLFDDYLLPWCLFFMTHLPIFPPDKAFFLRQTSVTLFFLLSFCCSSTFNFLFIVLFSVCLSLFLLYFWCLFVSLSYIFLFVLPLFLYLLCLFFFFLVCFLFLRRFLCCSPWLFCFVFFLFPLFPIFLIILLHICLLLCVYLGFFSYKHPLSALRVWLLFLLWIAFLSSPLTTTFFDRVLSFFLLHWLLLALVLLFSNHFFLFSSCCCYHCFCYCFSMFRLFCLSSLPDREVSYLDRFLFFFVSV